MFGGNYAPVNWALCDGKQLKISDYNALYSLIGTTYGGDGVQNFNLPDLRGRVPIHMGQGQGLTNRPIGSSFGAETVTLDATNLPAHNHLINTGGDATTAAPSGNYPANSTGFSLYSLAAADSSLNTAAVDPFSLGTVQPHSNLMPTQCVNFIIALIGYFPQRA
jgi:microcystin-dependent protein